MYLHRSARELCTRTAGRTRELRNISLYHSRSRKTAPRQTIRLFTTVDGRVATEHYHRNQLEQTNTTADPSGARRRWKVAGKIKQKKKQREEGERKKKYIYVPCGRTCV